MAEPAQTTQGAAQVQYRLKIPPAQTIPFDPLRIVFLEATIFESVYGDNHADHIFRSADPNFLRALQSAMSSANPTLQFRLGFGDPSKTYWLPWQNQLIVNQHAKFQGLGDNAGHLLVIKTAGALTRARRTKRVVARKGLISAIVTAIAAENSLECVVEPTDGIFNLIQSYTDSISFAYERLLPRAINPQGQAGYYLFTRDGVLHFHTVAYQAGISRLNYYRALGDSLEADDHSEMPVIWENGIAGVNLIVYNPISGRATQVNSDPAKATKLSDSIYQFANVSDGVLKAIYHAGENAISELNAIAQSQYQLARQRTFQTTIHTQKIINIRHGDLLQLVIAQESKQTSNYTGYYYVVDVTHKVKQQQVSTTYTLERGEIAALSQNVTAQGPNNQIVPQTDAPGIVPNFKALQASDQTKGAGSQSSSTGFAKVQSPD